MSSPEDNEWLDLAELADTAVWLDTPETPPRPRWKLIDTQREFDVTFRVENRSSDER